MLSGNSNECGHAAGDPMPLSIAIQMDHVSTVNIMGDTSFALSLEAQRRGHTLLHYTPDRLAQRGTSVFALAEPVTVADVAGGERHFRPESLLPFQPFRYLKEIAPDLPPPGNTSPSQQPNP